MIRSLFAVALIAATLLVGCSSDDGGTDPGPTPDPNNSFRVDGSGINNVLVTTEASGRSAVEVLGTTAIIQLTGSADGTTYRLQVKVSNVAVDTITVDPTAGATASLQVGTFPSADVYEATAGTIGISAWGGEGGTVSGTVELTLTDGSGQKTVTVTGSFEIAPILADPVNAVRANGWIFPNILLPAYDPLGSTEAAQSLGGDGVVTLTTDIDGAIGTLTLTLKDVEVGTFPISQTAGNAASYILDDDGQKASLFGNGGEVTIETWEGPGGKATGYFDITVSEGLNAENVSLIGSFDTSPIGNAD